MEFSVRRADVRPGESWADAADRVAGPSASGPVVAVDLRTDPLRFGRDPAVRIGCRPMTAGDLGLVARWIDAPQVARWWDHDGAATPAHYGPALAGEDPTRLWIWEINGRSVGFMQDYRVGDHPEWALLTRHPDAVGFDYAVGDPAYTGRGLGVALLWVYLRDVVVPAYPDVTELFAAPDHRNTASRRVLAKLGAVEGVWFDEPDARGAVNTVVGCSIDVRTVLRAPSPSDPPAASRVPYAR